MKIFIVDDHTLFREGVAAIIGSERDIEIAGLAGSVQEAVEKVRELKPDIILMDYDLPDGTGADATRTILEDQPDCKIIFLTICEENDALFAAIRSGAKGYLLKTIHPQKLLAEIRLVYQGEAALSGMMTLRLMEELARSRTPEHKSVRPHDKLSRREIDVLRVLASGMTNQEISRHLFLSPNTVKSHVHSILDKLNITDRRAAAYYAQQHGLIN